ncbi:MAG: hypothetical protein RM368_22550 [Nostoc sp. DedSLP03]|nr:hypothetical protein [Nostoc sp. DedSLP03]MDZ7967699.1 hypothetical protein [Nostoc sp. DedSLP03]
MYFAIGYDIYAIIHQSTQTVTLAIASSISQESQGFKRQPIPIEVDKL